MFLADGTPTASIDVLQRLWTGGWPNDLAPVTDPIESDVAGRAVAPGAAVTARIAAADPEGRPLTYRWELRRASGGAGNFGHPEPATADLSDALGAARRAGRVAFDAPAEPGPYRLFVFVRDDAKAATANVPFLVAADAPSP